MLEIGSLELQPSFLQHSEGRITPGGRRQCAFRDREIQLSQVTAAQMTGEVARRELEPIRSLAHIKFVYHFRRRRYNRSPLDSDVVAWP